MSVQLASAYMQIIPSMQGFQGTISRQLAGEGTAAGRTVGTNFTGSFKSIVGAGAIGGIVGGVAGAAATAVGGALARGFGAAKAAIFGFNSTLQQSSIGFTTMLGSAQKAQSFVSQLQQFAAKTPFEFQGLVQNANNLLGMGVASNQILPTLKALGDSTASVGGNATVLNNTISAFGQTMAKGTLDMGNMNQLLQGGVPNALKILASSYHVTTGEMVKMISAGTVQSADALPRLIKGIEQGTSATAALGGMMDKQSVTMQGALSNISDSSTQLLARAFKPLFDFASAGANRLATLLGSPQMTVWAGKIATATQGALNAFRAFTGQVSAALSGLFSGGSAFAPFTAFLSQMGAALAPLIPALVQAATAFSPLRIVFTALAPVLPVITLALTQLASALGQGLLGAVTAVAPGIVAITNGLVGLLVPLLRTPALVQGVVLGLIAWKVAAGGIAFGQLVAGLVQSTVALGVNAAAWVRNAAAQVASKAQTVAIMALYAGEFVANLVRSGVALGVQAAQWIASTAAMVAARVAMVAGAVATGVATAAQWALNAALTANPIGIVVVAIGALVAGLIWFFTQTKVGQAIWAGFVSRLQVGWNQLVGAWNAVIGAFARGWGQLTGGIGAVVAGFARGWAQITGGVRAAWTFVVNFITAYVNRVRAVVTAVVAVIVAVWNRYWSLVGSIIRTIWSAISSYVSSVINRIRAVIVAGVSAIRATWQAGMNAVRAVVTAVWNAIAAVISAVIGRVRSIVSAGVSFVRSAWQAGMNAVLSTVRSIWNSVVSAISGAVGRAVGVVRTMGGQILSAVGRIASQMFDAGAAIVGGLAKGISSAVGAATGAIGDVISAVANFLPHSPAKEGPLSGRGWSGYSGQALARDFASGMLGGQHAVRGAASGLMSSADLQLQSHVAVSAYRASGASASSVQSATRPAVVQHITANGYSADEVADRIAAKSRRSLYLIPGVMA